MKPKEFSVIVRTAGRSKAVEASVRMIPAFVNAGGKSYGLTEYYGPKGKKHSDGAKVWIFHRQTPREIADTFFHEMAHVFLHFLGGVKKQGKREEYVCHWIGCLAKAMLADYDPKYRSKILSARRRSGEGGRGA